MLIGKIKSIPFSLIRYKSYNCEREEIYSSDSSEMVIIEKLIKGGADPNAKIEDSIPLLIYSAKRELSSAVIALVQNGADPNVYDEDHRSPLFLCIMNGMYIAAEELVKAGADTLFFEGARLACEQRHGSIQLEPMMYKSRDDKGNSFYRFYRISDIKGRFVCDSCQTTSTYILVITKMYNKGL